MIEIENRPALESVEKEAKVFLRPEMNRESAGSGRKKSLVRAANQQGLIKGTRSDRVIPSVMPAQPDIPGMLP